MVLKLRTIANTKKDFDSAELIRDELNKLNIQINDNKKRDYLHISDLFYILEKSLKLNKVNNKIFNLCTGKGVTLLDIANIVKKKNTKIDVVNDEQINALNLVGNNSKLIKYFDYKPKRTIKNLII